MLSVEGERVLEEGIKMDSLPLLVFFLFVVPTIGMGLALLGAVLHRVAHPVAAHAARGRYPLPRHHG